MPKRARSATRSNLGAPAVIDQLRYRIAVRLWPQMLLERDPRVVEIVRVSFRAGQIVRLPDPRSAADAAPADVRGRDAEGRAR